MRRLFADMNPFLRGMLIVAAVAAIVVAFQLYAALAVVNGLLRIAFFLAIAFFIYLLWRERRGRSSSGRPARSGSSTRRRR